MKKLTSWKDSPFASPKGEVKVESYLYLTMDSASPHYHPTAQFVRIDEKIAGVKVTTTYRLHIRDRIDGSHLRIEEQTAEAGAHFGEKGSARTTTQYFPERETDPVSGLSKETRAG